MPGDSDHRREGTSHLGSVGLIKQGALWALPLILPRSFHAGEGPYFGWLCSRLQIYPDTLLLKTHVHPRAAGTRPYIELEPTDHPLAVEQRNGITSARVREIGELVEHKWLHRDWGRQGPLWRSFVGHGTGRRIIG